MQAVTPGEFFEKVLPQRFDPSKAAGIDVTAQISISGPNGGSWTVTIKDQTIKVEEKEHPAPDLSLKIAEKDYMDLVNNKLSAEKAFFTGKVKFKGNIALALKLRDAGFL
ncbi:MAG: SCP2 sterol-binding domain-containing protein [Candidatus Bathyarchaeota archaeon]|nr:SCP2 sterol-binding domain-containing protein [Candidatus Bathyarchaeota archaeon]